jgi:hypothetical protein
MGIKVTANIARRVSAVVRLTIKYMYLLRNRSKLSSLRALLNTFSPARKGWLDGASRGWSWLPSDPTTNSLIAGMNVTWCSWKAPVNIPQECDTCRLLILVHIIYLLRPLRPFFICRSYHGVVSMKGKLHFWYQLTAHHDSLRFRAQRKTKIYGPAHTTDIGWVKIYNFRIVTAIPATLGVNSFCAYEKIFILPCM